MTPAPTTERLLSIQRMVADQLGDKLPDFEVDALREWEPRIRRALSRLPHDDAVVDDQGSTYDV